MDQTTLVLRKNLAILLRSKTFWVNLYIPVLCAIFWIYSRYSASRNSSTLFLYGLWPLYLTLPLNGVIRQLVTQMIEERQGKHKEIQKIMGLSTNSYYAGWTMTNYSFQLIIGIVYILICLIGQTYSYPESTSLTFFDAFFSYILYILSLTSFTMFVSSFFEDAKVASEMSGLINLFLSIFSGTLIVSQSPGFGYKLPFMLFPQCSIQIAWQSQGWFYFMHPVEQNESIWIYNSFLALQFVGYLIGYLYFDQVVPREIGGSKHPFFCLKWFRKTQVYQDFEEDLMENNNQEVESNKLRLNQSFQQSMHEDLPIVSILGLQKRQDGQNILNNINLDLYQNEIFCLLGPNGAGKSTLTNIISGISSKTKGVVKIDGLDIDTHDIRKTIGICTQKDILYSNLTIMEHLIYYSGIKGIPEDQEYIRQILQQTLLIGQENFKINQLSGGNKRKVCLAIALLGNPKVIILDEPSSGMDPQTRQELWGLIKSLKQGRCVFLTTHHLDEAEELATKIAILFNGNIVTMGSPEFIKLSFGLGYNLTMEFENAQSLAEQRNKITQQLQLFQRDCFIQQTNTLTLQTVFAADKLNQMHDILNYFENQVQCKVSLRMNSLEESYLAIEAIQNPKEIDMNVGFIQDPNPTFANQILGIFLRKHYIISQSAGKILRYMLGWPLIILGVHYAQDGSGQELLFVLFFILAKSISMSSILSITSDEKESKVKDYLISSGVKLQNYWLGSYAYDIIPNLIDAGFITLMLVLSDVGYWARYGGHTFFMLFIFNMSFTSFTYFLSIPFKNTISLYLTLPILTFVVFFIVPLIPSLSIFGNQDYLMLLIMIVSPFYSVYIGLAFTPFEYSKVYYSYTSCICWLLLSAAIYMALTIVIEIKQYRKIQLHNLDPQRAVEVENLTKVYNNRTVLAGINMSVNKQEIYGLLGPNGAGKSTAFKLLTRFETQSSGNIYIDKEETNVGTVPQFSPFYSNLSIYDHLYIYGIIKGQNNLKESIRHYLQALDLERIQNREVRYLSGGERRKVQLGIAMIGGSNRLFMDEPTTGLDPKSKKIVQQLLVSAAENNSASVVLTTHSMQEAQNICNKIGIVVNGSIIAQGTVDDLRKQLGDFVRFSVLCNNGRQQTVNKHIIEHLGQVMQLMPLQDLRENHLSYQVSSQQVRLSMLYYFLNIELKQKHQLITNFSIFQPQLDQIFAFYAQQQVVDQQGAGQEAEPFDVPNAFRIATGVCCCVFW